MIDGKVIDDKQCCHQPENTTQISVLNFDCCYFGVSISVEHFCFINDLIGLSLRMHHISTNVFKWSAVCVGILRQLQKQILTVSRLSGEVNSDNKNNLK